MTPLLSILVPTFNRSGYLRQCLDSLLETTVPCEILVGDNCSEDDTGAVVASYADPRIRYFRHDRNIGSTANHNFLLQQVRGKYACLFGDDDIANFDCFEKKVALLEARPDLDLVYSRAQGIDPEGQSTGQGFVMGQSRYSYAGGRDEFAALLVNCYISWQTLVFRSSILAEVGLLDESWGLQASIDWFWLQRMVRGRGTAYLCEPTVKIRFHPGSFTMSEVIREGYWGTDRFLVWRHWLLVDPNPPVLSEDVWARMDVAVRADVNNFHDGDPEQLAASRQALAELRVQHRQRLEDRAFAAIVSNDPYQPGAPAWPLADRRRTAFLLPPGLTPEVWDAAIVAFADTFSSADDVTLVLCADPAQGRDADEVGERAILLLAQHGTEDPPDLLLVRAATSQTHFAHLYAAVDAIQTGGDRLIAHRARRMGKVAILDIDAASWQAGLVPPADQDPCEA